MTATSTRELFDVMVGLFISGLVAGLLVSVLIYGGCVVIQTIRAIPDEI